MEEGRAKEAGEEQSKPSTVQERLSRQLAYPDPYIKKIS